MSHPNEALLRRFYEAFARRDAAAMGACYADDVRFSDPVFPELRGERARAMWSMLCERGKDLVIEASGFEADEREGRAHWEARYTFGATGRAVHNVIDATFRFERGLVVAHDDRFDFHRWARQALGPTGLLLGWTPLLRNQVRKQAAAGLDAFVARRSR